MRILVVEDEKNLNDIIVKKLKKEKYGVDSCFDGKDAIDYILATEYDVIILDIMLPKLNGFEVLKSIRNKNIKTPVLMLTAKDGIEDKVQGLDLGADDYLIKPFSFDELLARIRVLLRRNSTNNNANNEVNANNNEVNTNNEATNNQVNTTNGVNSNNEATTENEA